MEEKLRAKNNRTTFVRSEEVLELKKKIVSGDQLTSDIYNKTIWGRLEDVTVKIPEGVVDLLFIDPPYNLNKDFGNNKFRELSGDDYQVVFEKWLLSIMHTLKKNASVYVCCDWKSSPMIFNVLDKHLKVRNRITWEREKGRGALSNWKNCSEDIWFATVSDDYKFNVEAVKLKKKVIAPYKENGLAKDWAEESDGKFRLTHPSNLWTDITIPFWSMPENTDHPTQKPEKLVAKILLASTHKDDVVLDPFLGSGTTSVVAKKLGRKYIGIEMNEEYCCLAEKRIAMVDKNPTIQGYLDGVFWERNSLIEQKDSNGSTAFNATLI
ncbi:site-specific DNA-methyltransferase [Patescibacteria group bacterium]|nr:site-specific DNA-methyltransferase [Patescibacteria group bacterium]